MSKAGAEVILKSLLNREIDVDSLPWGPDDETLQVGIETVIMAHEVRPRRGMLVDVIEVKREGGGVRRVAVDVVGDIGEQLDDDEVILVKDEPLDDD